jgi:hypothetical protein
MHHNAGLFISFGMAVATNVIPFFPYLYGAIQLLNQPVCHHCS